MRKLETAFAFILAAGISPTVAGAQAPGIAAAGRTAELRSLSDNMFSRWDINNNDLLEGREFLAGLHERWSGPDGVLAEQEYERNWNRWFTAAPPPFAALDQNNDRDLSPEELLVPLTDADLRGEWQGVDDADLTPDEFWAGLNTVSDLDRSGGLDEQEAEQLGAVVGVYVPEATEAPEPVPPQAVAPAAPPEPMEAEERSGVEVGTVIPLSQWNPDELYATAWSAEALFDRPVFGAEGEEIGDVEDLIIGPAGNLLSLVAEVGGLWDLGDTHVSVPWEQVVVRVDGTIAIPVTEDNADDFSVLRDDARHLAQEIVSDMDNKEVGPRAWRASELIGDIVRVRGGAAPRTLAYGPYGYVEDLIFNDGKLTAAVVDLDPAGPEEVAYPFYGYEYGWTPGNPYYDLPYDRDEAATIEPFEVDRLNER
ncbi:MAG: PRC-barrel domain-containing protein [Pseudorhizobium sp.]